MKPHRMICRAAHAAPLDHPNLRAALEVYDAWVRQTMAERGQPGVSIGIVHDQELVWAKGYGHADAARRTPATPATLFRIASITKVITATAIMRLRDEGRLQGSLSPTAPRSARAFARRLRHGHEWTITSLLWDLWRAAGSPPSSTDATT